MCCKGCHNKCARRSIYFSHVGSRIPAPICRRPFVYFSFFLSYSASQSGHACDSPSTPLKMIPRKSLPRGCLFFCFRMFRPLLRPRPSGETRRLVGRDLLDEFSYPLCVVSTIVDYPLLGFSPDPVLCFSASRASATVRSLSTQWCSEIEFRGAGRLAYYNIQVTLQGSEFRATRRQHLDKVLIHFVL